MKKENFEYEGDFDVFFDGGACCFSFVLRAKNIKEAKEQVKKPFDKKIIKNFKIWKTYQ